MDIYFAVFLTESTEPQKPVAIFESCDSATIWVKAVYPGKRWEIRRMDLPEIREIKTLAASSEML